MWQELAVNGRGRCWTAGVGQENSCVDNAVRRVVPRSAKVPSPGEMAGDTRERVSRLQLFRRLLLASSIFTATTRPFPLPPNTSGLLRLLHLPSSSRPINRADMCIGDAY